MIAIMEYTEDGSSVGAVRIVISAGKEVTVTVPFVHREDVLKILATFLGRREEKAAAQLHAKLAEASEFTLVLTTKRQ